MSTLDDVIDRIRSEMIDRELWLYIEGTGDDLVLKTHADLGVPELDEVTDKEIDPREFVERGLNVTIDAETVEQSIKWADSLASVADNQAAASVIRYYIRFDAWPDRLDAPDPPPPAETSLRLYREFVDSLGPERDDTQCRRDDCARGAVELSVFCRRHHFENVKQVLYPFDD